MKFNLTIMVLLCGLLLWSIHINEQIIHELDRANEIILRQNKSIKEYSEMLNELVDGVDNTNLDKKIDLPALMPKQVDDEVVYYT